jgi:hypothetical protein
MSGKESELLYEMHATVTSQRCAFTSFCKLCENVLYCDSISNCTHCFGCIGLKHKKFCILNTQYTEQEYNDLVPRIIEHMRKTPLRSADGSSQLRQGYDGQAAGQEWGENVPISLSPFAYNETVAQEHFPLRREEATTNGWRWKDVDQQDFRPQTYRVPEDIGDMPDSITKETIACDSCGKNFRIIAQELAFYRRMRLPVPGTCHDCRHRDRRLLRKPYRLWDRACAKCGQAVRTGYAPDRPEIIYCESCYLQSVY